MTQVDTGIPEKQEMTTESGGRIEQFLMMDGGVLALIGLIFGIIAMLDRYIL
jgi:hypothetical protein